MKFPGQAWICLAICDFEAQIMLSVCLNFQGVLLLSTPMCLCTANLFVVSIKNKLGYFVSNQRIYIRYYP